MYQFLYDVFYVFQTRGFIFRKTLVRTGILFCATAPNGPGPPHSRSF